MSQINLSNWEIVDVPVDGLLEIRSKQTGEKLAIDEQGGFSSTSSIDADTVDGVEATDLGGDYDDDESIVFGTDNDITQRYDSTNDEFRITDGETSTDRVAIERQTGNLKISGQIIEGNTF